MKIAFPPCALREVEARLIQPLLKNLARDLCLGNWPFLTMTAATTLGSAMCSGPMPKPLPAPCNSGRARTGPCSAISMRRSRTSLIFNTLGAYSAIILTAAWNCRGASIGLNRGRWPAFSPPWGWSGNSRNTAAGYSWNIPIMTPMPPGSRAGRMTSRPA